MGRGLGLGCLGLAALLANPITAKEAASKPVISHGLRRRLLSAAPPLDLLRSVLSTEPHLDVGSDASVLEELHAFEWDRLVNNAENRNQQTNFLVCTEGGRQDVEDVLDRLPPQNAVPLSADSETSLTCHVVGASPLDITRLFESDARSSIKYVSPLPPTFKVSKVLLQTLTTATAPEDGPCSVEGSIRIDLGPGGDSTTSVELGADSATKASGLAGWASVLEGSLKAGAIAEHLNERLYWLGSGDEGSKEGAKGKPTKWRRSLKPVVDGEVACDFSGTSFTQGPPGSNYVVLSLGQSFCKMKPECILAATAFIASEPQVMHMHLVPYVAPGTSHMAIGSSPQPKQSARRRLSPAKTTTQYWKDFYGMGIAQGTNVSRFWSLGVTGSDQVIQILDSGLNTTSCFFANNQPLEYIEYTDAFDTTGHGTQLGGVTVGKSTQYGDNFKGLAYGAKNCIFDLGDEDGRFYVPLGFTDVALKQGHESGALVSLNGWTSNYASTYNGYTSLDVEVDTYSYYYKHALVVFPAGDYGVGGANTVMTPGLSKNAITVGAYDADYSIATNAANTQYELTGTYYAAYFSSQGPTKDGRYKPDVLAPGVNITVATAGDCKTTQVSGTHLSAAFVAGYAALIRQWFLDGYYTSGIAADSSSGFNATGALVKAVIINSAQALSYSEDMDGNLDSISAPGNKQGWGRVDVAQSLNINQERGFWFKDYVGIRQDVWHTYKFTVPKYNYYSTNDSFSVTLVWMDPPVSALSRYMVLHDLDLLVKNENTGTTYYPNGKTSAESKHNVEKVTIANSALSPGDTISVTVTGTSVTTDTTQYYSIVASGPFVSYAWYCQDPSIHRTDKSFISEYCLDDAAPYYYAGGVTSVASLLAEKGYALTVPQMYWALGEIGSNASSTFGATLTTIRSAFTTSFGSMGTWTPAEHYCFLATLHGLSSFAISNVTSLFDFSSTSDRHISYADAVSWFYALTGSSTLASTYIPSSISTFNYTFVWDLAVDNSLAASYSSDTPLNYYMQGNPWKPYDWVAEVTAALRTAHLVAIYNRFTRCCASDAGDSCDDTEFLSSTSSCDVTPLAPDSYGTDNIDYSAYTASPTGWPTPRPTAPTQTPTRRPTSPTASPTKKPTKVPTGKPTKSPTMTPTRKPTKSPTQTPSKRPTRTPTKAPTRRPTESPSKSPTTSPTLSPSKAPTTSPSTAPTTAPSLSPSKAPTTSPSTSPSTAPTQSPSKSPTTAPTEKPSTAPTEAPTTRPTTAPTTAPSKAPTTSPSEKPSSSPTETPTKAPTTSPTQKPSTAPTTSPSTAPTTAPTTAPSKAPTTSPSEKPSSSPTESPTKAPTTAPTEKPSTAPTEAPTTKPTKAPTESPTRTPTAPTTAPTKGPWFGSPTTSPTPAPTAPTESPTTVPTQSPTGLPTKVPTTSPTQTPSKSPTQSPSTVPTTSPTTSPTKAPTTSPSEKPSTAPTETPTKAPTTSPTTAPSKAPTESPSTKPTTAPSESPTKAPTTSPSTKPSTAPTESPTTKPTTSPSLSPTKVPTGLPTTKPSTSPTGLPTKTPSQTPSKSPSQTPTSTPTVGPTAPTQTPTKRPSGAPTTRPTGLPTTTPTKQPSQFEFRE